MTTDDLLNIDPDSYVKGVEEGKRNATPSIEKQSEIVAQIDKLIENLRAQIETLTQLRTTLLVQWFNEGNETKREFILPTVRAQRYFKTFIEPYRNGITRGTNGITRGTK